MEHIQLVQDDNGDFVTVTYDRVRTRRTTPTPTPHTNDKEDGEDGVRPDSSPSWPLTDSEVPSSKGDSTGLLDSVRTEPLDDDPDVVNLTVITEPEVQTQ
jgi:hypothetical protein